MANLPRRELLGSGLAGLAALLCGYPQSARAQRPPAQAMIFLFMSGGPSQIDTWDPKPGRPGAGPTAAIKTTMPGVRFSEHLPRLARRAHMLSVIRSMVTTEASHERARRVLFTSHPAQAGEGPAPLGSLRARSHSNTAIPGYVTILGQRHPPGALGPAFGAFRVADPSGAAASLRSRPKRLQPRQGRRFALWRRFDDAFQRGHASPGLEARRVLWERAFAMASSAQDAFDISREPTRLRARYGIDSPFGQGCMLARRLVENGVPFVEVTLGGWDTHFDNHRRTRDRCNQLDTAMAALLDDLKSRGLLDRVLVLCAGEFGRTPWLNARGGRDHYRKGFSLALAGAGMPAGRIIGATDRDGREIRERPIALPDLLRTIAVRLGIDPDETLLATSGRPTPAIARGELIPELG